MLSKLLREGLRTFIEVEAMEADGAAFFEAARKLGLEGIVSKRASSPYRSGRQSSWVKVKCKLSDTFTVIGFADEAGSRPPRVGALYVGRRDGDRLAYAGKIQIGLTLDQAAELRATLREFAQAKAPVSHPPRRPKAVWLLRHLQAEVAYSNVTAESMLRHGVLKGLRYDFVPMIGQSSE